MLSVRVPTPQPQPLYPARLTLFIDLLSIKVIGIQAPPADIRCGLHTYIHDRRNIPQQDTQAAVAESAAQDAVLLCQGCVVVSGHSHYLEYNVTLVDMWLQCSAVTDMCRLASCCKDVYLVKAMPVQAHVHHAYTCLWTTTCGGTEHQQQVAPCSLTVPKRSIQGIKNLLTLS